MPYSYRTYCTVDDSIAVEAKHKRERKHVWDCGTYFFASHEAAAPFIKEFELLAKEADVMDAKLDWTRLGRLYDSIRFPNGIQF